MADSGNFRMPLAMRNQLAKVVIDLIKTHEISVSMSQVVRFCLEDNLDKTIKKLMEDRHYLEKKLAEEKKAKEAKRANKKAEKTQ